MGGPSRLSLPSAALPLLLALLATGGWARRGHYHYRVPIIDLNGAEELIGTVREDDPLVTVSPQLRILHGTGPLCRYELAWADSDASSGSAESIPFEARVLDSAEGTAQLRRKEASAQLDCARKADYRLRLVAVKCGDELAKSEPVDLRIAVQDVNNHAPEFDAPWYSFDVDEAKAPLEIARLLATDKDCGHPYGEVCRYRLTNTLADNPFRVDDRGVLSAVRPLNRSQAQSHILTVVAEDCGMLRSKSVLVTINVRPRCVDSIRSASAHSPLHMAQGESPKRLFPDGEVIACEHRDCAAEVQIELEQRPGEPGHLLAREQLAECGLDRSAGVELLPVEEEEGKRNNGTGAKEQGDDGKDEEEGEEEEEDGPAAQHFDGNKALDVPESKVSRVIPERFTLLFSMRTEAGTAEQQKQKQNILCETDANGLNRHHFSVYLRHCKLELLLRREPEEASAEFRAAEWRWNDQRICDGEWHRFGLVFTDVDNVRLTIDGHAFNASDRNPEVLDDWPLHRVRDKKTRLVLGACWHGRQRQMVQHFNGHLSSAWLWPGKAHPLGALDCVHGQHEHLAMADDLSLGHGQSVLFSADRSRLRLRSPSPAQMAPLLRSLQFSVDPLFSSSDHSRLAPSLRQGARLVALTGSLNCPNNVSRPLAPIHATVDVRREPLRPRLSVTGRHIVVADRQSLKTGASLLPDVQIEVTQGSSDVSAAFKLDWCRIHMRPSRDMDLELFSSPTPLLEQLELHFAHDRMGFALKGAESAPAYAEVLQKVHYFNLRPESFPHRSYTLQCAMMDGKVLSNELFVTMNIDPVPTASGRNADLDEAVQKLVQLSDRLDQDLPLNANNEEEGRGRPAPHREESGGSHLDVPSFDQLGANRLQNILEMDLPRPKALLGHHYEVGQGAVAGGAVAIVVVICVGLLLVLLVVGVLKMRDQPLGPRRRRSRRESLLEWDDNGMMNITVNPLEEVGGKAEMADRMVAEYSEAEEEEEDEEEDSGSEDGGESYRGVEGSEDEEGDDAATQVLPLAAEGGRKGAGLEWDDSTLDGPMTSASGMGMGSQRARKGYNRV